MFIGLDPITQEEYDIKDWIMMNDNNLILNIKENKKDYLYLINKNLLDIPNLKNIYIKCVYNNNTFLPNETYNSKEKYVNIGYLIGKKCVIPEKEIKKFFLKKKKIININLTDKSDDFINKEHLLLQYIGLYKERININDTDKVKTQKKAFNKNIPYKLDVYFENILADALWDYSNVWDAPINNYLRLGDKYFNSEIFKYYEWKYEDKKHDSVTNIKKKIQSLDRVFLGAAPRNEDNQTVYWRGMKTPFENLNDINDQIIVPNFLSLSTSLKIAYSFSGYAFGENCCMYKFIIDKGVPIINMINTTKWKYENETLIPRNITCTLINKSVSVYYNDVGIINVFEIRVSLNNINDFKITNMCYNYVYSNISISSNKDYEKYINNKNSVKVNNKYVKVNKKSVKVNKKSVKVNIKSVKVNKNKKEKQKRCPNGTRRNIKSGLCETLIKNNVVKKIV
jgi:hypothetical protein